MTKQNLIIIVLAATVLLLVALLYFNGKGGSVPFGGTSHGISPNILSITQPVMSFSGVVEKVSGNTLTVSQRFTLTQPEIVFVAGQVPTPSTPEVKKISYRVQVTKDTQITRPPLYIPYLLKPNTPVTNKIVVSDVKVGEAITVYSPRDLRRLSSDEFEAIAVQLPAIRNTISGIVVEASGTQITLRAVDVTSTQQVPKQRDYIVYITSQTEISRPGVSTEATAGSIKPEKLASSDIQKDTQVVTAYTDSDVTEVSSFTALLVVLPIRAPESPGAVVPIPIVPSRGITTPQPTATPAVIR